MSSNNKKVEILIKENLKIERKIEEDNTYPKRTICLIPKIDIIEKESIFKFDDFDPEIFEKMKIKENQIYSQDRRDIVENPTIFPFSTIGVLTFVTSDGETKYGTATLIGSNLVLTCAHNVYDNENNKHYKNHIFHACPLNGTKRDTSKVLKIFFPNEFKGNNNNKDDEDYALLILDKELGNKYGYMGLAPDYILDESSKYGLYGYPADKQDPRSFNLWGMKSSKDGIFIDPIKNTLSYNAFDTYGGQSGSSIWVQENDGKAFIFGIHTNGLPSINGGVYLNKAKYENIIKWIQELNINTTIIKEETSLNLNFKKIGENGIKFLKKRKITSLNFLHIIENDIFEKGVEYLSKCKFKELKLINLSENKIGDKGLEYLAKCDFEKLNTLYLRKNQISEQGVKNLAKCNFKELRLLYLCDNIIGDIGVENLINCNFKKINELGLSSNNIKENGILHLSNCDFKSLSILNLRDNKILEKGVKHLINCEFKELKSLDISLNEIKSIGIEYLKKCNFAKLTAIDLSLNEILSIEVETLKSYYPNARIAV